MARLPACCARAASGHAAAAPPSSVMNSRRYHSMTSSARASSEGGTVEAECPGRLRVDDKFELDRLHDWKIGGLLTLKNAASVVAGETETVRSIGAVSHQAARFDKRTVRGDRRYCMAERHCSELFTAGTKKAIGPDHQRTCLEVH